MSSTGQDGNYTLTGSNILFIELLAAKLNFTFTYYYVPNNMTKVKYGNLSDFAILINLLAHKEVDGSVVAGIVTPERARIMDYAYFIVSEPNAIVVCLFIFLSMLMVVFLLTLLTAIHYRLVRSNKSHTTTAPSSKFPIWQTASNYAMYVINTITNQGNTVPGSRFNFKIIIGSWLLAAVVLVNCYSGTVVSYLTAPRMIPSINNFEDLTASEDVGVLVIDNYVIGKQTMDAHTGALKILGDQVRRHPDRILNNMRKASSTHWKLGITLFLFQMKVWETGLPNYWKKVSIHQAPKCFTNRRPEAAKKMPIRLNDLLGAFLILAVQTHVWTAIVKMDINVLLLGYICSFHDFGRLLMDSLGANGVSSDDMDSWKGALNVFVNGISPKN
uniref:Ionotropic glutamate receptor C-terminal domain-containing protein n=1 Tax=Daphnia galeata TaxID=27404 RepID=A0A8J2RBC4_9CRUS|nr:unnamed protein product [Daphnia galeata]